MLDNCRATTEGLWEGGTGCFLLLLFCFVMISSFNPQHSL